MIISQGSGVGAFPLGGIGTGNVSLGVRGELRDWELANRPAKGAWLPFTFFAIRVGGEDASVTRVLEARIPPPHDYEQGYEVKLSAGLPRLDRSRMTGEYPLVRIEFEDDILPVSVTLEAFTPFVPLDADASGIPAAILRYSVRNTGAESVDVTIAGSLSNPIGRRTDRPWEFDGSPTNAWRDDGVVRGLELGSDFAADDVRAGTLALVTSDSSTTAKPVWLSSRVGTDGIQDFWDDLSSDGLLSPIEQPTFDSPADFLNGDEEAAPSLLRVGSLGIVHTLEPGDSQTFEFVLAWSFPNRVRGWDGSEDTLAATALPGTMRNHYATQFADAWSAARSLMDRLPGLEAATRDFHRALHKGTLDPAIVDAVSANLAVIRSTTCLRIEGGVFAAWEGSFNRVGSCFGTCTHVWNYAQAVAFLFPELERSARRVEFGMETDLEGAMQFRTNRVFGGESWGRPPAVDGQLGTIVRFYREWRHSADREFLTECWPAVKRALEFAIDNWDSNGDLVLDGQQHNTYDIEFFGESSLLNSLFYAALAAGAALAEAVGDSESAARYRSLGAQGSARMDELLFTGEYYRQGPYEDEPPYQYGSGVLSDQVFGQSLAHLAGLGDVLPREHVRSALRSIFRYNFRSGLDDHVNAQRGYALNGESGLLNCSWPHGGRPRFPFIYSDEVWTGIEYQVASHMLYEGMLDEALTIVRAVRARHDGVARNPWNEAECGNHYARSLASWGLLHAATGAQYDAPARALAFNPAFPGALRSFFITNEAWGTVSVDDGMLELEVLFGALDVDSVTLAGSALSTDRKKGPVRAGETVRFVEQEAK